MRKINPIKIKAHLCIYLFKQVREYTNLFFLYCLPKFLGGNKLWCDTTHIKEGLNNFLEFRFINNDYNKLADFRIDIRFNWINVFLIISCLLVRDLNILRILNFYAESTTCLRHHLDETISIIIVSACIHQGPCFFL